MMQRFSRRLPSLLFSLLLAAGFCLFFAACNTPLGPSVNTRSSVLHHHGHRPGAGLRALHGDL